MSKRDNDRNASRQMLNKLSQYSQKELYNDEDDDFLFEIENLKSNKKTQKSETKKRRNEEYWVKLNTL